MPLVGPSLKLPGNLAATLVSPNNNIDGKPFPSGADEKGIGALGMGGQGRHGLDANGNALTVHKRQPKEETV